MFEWFAWWHLVALLVAGLIVRFAWERRRSKTISREAVSAWARDHAPLLRDDNEEDGGVDFTVPVDDEPDADVIRAIRAANTPEELMGAVGAYRNLVGEENDVFLERALALGLTEEQWGDVFRVAAWRSELRQVAQERAGDFIFYE